MNRFTTTMGTLSGGAISRGTTGFDIAYDLAGNRHIVTDTLPDGTTADVETYTYTADGFLAEIDEKVGAGATNKIADYALDARGRATTYKEYGPYSSTSGNVVVYQRDAVYDAIGQVTSDTVYRVVGATAQGYPNWFSTQGTYTYTDGSGHWLGGVLVHGSTTASSNWGLEPATDTANSYVWRDSAVLSSTSYQANAQQTVDVPAYWDPSCQDWIPEHTVTYGSTQTWTSNYIYNNEGQLTETDISDGQPRTFTYVNNQMGEVLSRDVRYTNNSTVGVHDRHYYLAGEAVGDVSSDGPSRNDYAASIAAHTASVAAGSGMNPTVGYVTPNGYGPFQNGSNTATPHANFDQSYNPINGYDSTNTATNYTAHAGDTLSSIAMAVWGDASLWYLIAQANGLQANSQLQSGQSLIIPNNQVHNFHNSAATFKVYDPNVAYNDTAPTAPEIPPPPPPPSHHGGCGIIGIILVAIVAVAATIATGGALAAALPGATGGFWGGVGAFLSGSAFASGTAGAIATGIGIGAVAGAVGGIVSQGFAVATGIQDQFNWGAVAMSAIGGGVGGGLAATGAFGGGLAGAVGRGLAGSAISQGIGVATGLQSHFDWAGVAAAGVGAAAGYGMSKLVNYAPGADFSDFGNDLKGGLVGMANTIANAATRSVINGSDFGDNIMASLPDTIGQTIGNMAAGAFSGGGQRLVQAPDVTPNPIDPNDPAFGLPNLPDMGNDGVGGAAGGTPMGSATGSSSVEEGQSIPDGYFAVGSRYQSTTNLYSGPLVEKADGTISGNLVGQGSQMSFYSPNGGNFALKWTVADGNPFASVYDMDAGQFVGTAPLSAGTVTTLPNGAVVSVGYQQSDTPLLDMFASGTDRLAAEAFHNGDYAAGVGYAGAGVMTDLAVGKALAVGANVAIPALKAIAAPVARIISRGGASSVANIAESAAISDDAFVRFDPSKFDASISGNGILSNMFTDNKVWLTKYGDIKNVSSASDLETMLYRKNLWSSKVGYFDSGATLRVVNPVTAPIPAGVTNMTNGVRQWYITHDVAPQNATTLYKLLGSK
jgi:hypothetical protein